MPERPDFRSEPSFEDTLRFGLRDRHGVPFFQIGNMRDNLKRWREKDEGNKHSGSRWMVENPADRKRSLLEWAAGKSGGEYDKQFGTHDGGARTAMEMDLYGQAAYDVLQDEPTSEFRDMARYGIKPPASMEDMMSETEPAGGWAFYGGGYGGYGDPTDQYFPQNKTPLKALPPSMKNMMNNLKNAGTPPQEVLDMWGDLNTMEGQMNRHEGMPTDRDAFWRKQGGPRDRFTRRSSIEAAILLNLMDSQRGRDNNKVVSDFNESDLEWNKPHWDHAPKEPWAASPDYGEAQPLYETEEDEPVIWNQAFDENWQIMNRSADSFDQAWRIIKGIDDDENDDEFIDPDAFNDPVPDIIEQIMAIFGDKPEMDMCYSCGLEGDLRTFYNTSSSGRRERKCPDCGSYEIHGKNAYGGGQ